MKNVLWNIDRAVLTIAVILSSLFISCNKDDDDPQPEPEEPKVVSVTLNGASEVPAVSTTGSGTAQITYTPAEKTISYNLTWELGSAAATTTGMHFHGAENASDATSSPITIGLNGFPTGYTGTFSGTTRALTDAEVSQLLAGKWYLNIHSSDYPAGELRGNIKFP